MKTYFVVFQVNKYGVIVDDSDRCLMIKAPSVEYVEENIRTSGVIRHYHVSYKIYEAGIEEIKCVSLNN